MELKTGRIGEPGRYLVKLDEVDEYLKQSYPGYKVCTVPEGDPWFGAFKIIRPDGTHFWTTTWEGIGECALWKPGGKQGEIGHTPKREG